ncbi:hypothetical protein [Tritonibacter horizontis]|uniref:Uncharacterized protein n=1 Tax=Tritonibacter horizontis TaxID=1768241 RepID=A0A132BQH3_9RHOB|nr:hypothetical protein [Tritonibacter horizontis]KUP90641.1 hypothetical protein TRIHO_45070 [Tritonibacter horizontis]
MPTLVYVVRGDAPRAQQELSYSVLSALKHGLGDVEILLICDTANQRPDLPVNHHILPPDVLADWTGRAAPSATAGPPPDAVGLADAAGLALDLTQGPICLMATATAFRAPPQRLFDQFRPGVVLVQDQDGWLAGRPDCATVIAATRESSDEAAVHPGAALYDLGVLGIYPQDASCLKSSNLLGSRLIFLPEISNIEQLSLSLALGDPDREVRFARDLLEHYNGPMRHVYHGRFDVMFPARAPVNLQMAGQLPTITEPPKPLFLRWKAKLVAIWRRMGPGTQAGYLAYLCAFAAPTAEGRDVWANIALDHLHRSQRPRMKLRQEFSKLAPGAFETAGVKPATAARWLRFWMSSEA